MGLNRWKTIRQQYNYYGKSNIMGSTFFQVASITRKVTMGIAGLFLMMFLVVHLGINLCLLRPDDGEWYRAASHFMGSNYVIKIIEIMLFLALLVHIVLGVVLWIMNRMARPKRYYRTNRSDTAFMSKYMFHTGVIIAVFLVFHLFHFFYVKHGVVAPPEGVAKDDFVTMAALVFTDIWYSAAYIIALIVLGFHLNHAFQSVFQTFGLHHNKYYVPLRRTALIYAVVIAGGYILIPVYYLFFFQ